MPPASRPPRSPRLARWRHHEWWPAWLLYGLLAPRFLRLAVRHRSLTCWTCVNPGVHPGGGVVGESKQAVLHGFDDPRVLAQHDIDGPDRPARALQLLDSEPDLNGFPVIVKPDAGQRGAGVTLVHDRDQLTDTVARTPGRVIIQRYHPGPVELGVFWVRDPATVGRERDDTTQGRVFAVTRKVFPVVEGNGRSTLRTLILAHPRYAIQARVYLEQLGERANDTPANGERVQLTTTGNHARGCRFEDGADLITPEFESAIDTLARTWKGPAGEPFDFGRFDIRSTSEDAVRDATDLAVIELNGVTSEATNLYDPSWSAARALRLLAEQWSIAFDLGAARKAAGARPLSPVEILRHVLKRQ